MGRVVTSPTSEIDDLFYTLNELEAWLDNFQKQILPVLRNIGFYIGDFTYRIGERYQHSARVLYLQVQNQTQTQAGYTSQNISDLDSIERLAKKGSNIQKAAGIINTVTDISSWALQIYQKVKVRKEMIHIIEDEKKRLPILQDSFNQAKTLLAHCISNQEEHFLLIARQQSQNDEQRKNIFLMLTQINEDYLRLGEARARLDYYKYIYELINSFNIDQFRDSMDKLLKAGTEDKPLFIIQGINYYYEMLNEAIEKLNWCPPYYKNGLPEGILYFLKTDSNTRTACKRLPAIDKIIVRLRKETPSIARLKEFKQSFSYSNNKIGNIRLIFEDHLLIIKIFFYLMVLATLVLLIIETKLDKLFLGGLKEIPGIISLWVKLQEPAQLMTEFFLLFLTLFVVGWLVWMLSGNKASKNKEN